MVEAVGEAQQISVEAWSGPFGRHSYRPKRRSSCRDHRDHAPGLVYDFEPEFVECIL